MGSRGSDATEIGYLVKQAQAVLNARMGEALRPLDLTVPQYACLEQLRRQPGITSSELARRAFVTRQSMNVVLHGLAERGLVTRSEQPGPRKQIFAELTDAARDLVDRASERVAGVTTRMTQPLDEAGRAALISALATCRDALGTPLGDGRAEEKTDD
jgi:DNA-binding MarR family transcriptional regulator